ncbi:MAG TPA: amidohydrolase family protein [Chloroflexota bacterium]|nr:amidohydrolase family protein [Chloroflexota bacterium]
MKKIDVFPHIFPKPLLDRASRVAVEPVLGQFKRNSGIPVLYDLDARFRVMDQFGDYVQVLTISNPPIEAIGAPPTSTELARVGNDTLAELCVKYPDRFLGFAASLPMNDVDGTLREIDRAINELGALGVQIYTNVLGRPLDDPLFDQFWAKVAQMNKPIWVHPARSPAMPDYATEDHSKYEIWWTFGWPYETAVFMARVVFSGILDRYPNLKILTHHGGSMVPHFSGRIGPGMENLGNRTPGAEGDALVRQRETMAKKPVEYFKMFYGDTALFGAGHAIRCAMDFLGLDHMMFGSDMPFDPERGTAFIRWTIENIGELSLSEAQLADLYQNNAARILGVRV